MYPKMQIHIGKKEVTLESTPPLRRIHHHQLKSSSYKTNANPHLEISLRQPSKHTPSKHNKNMIHNLCNQVLTEEEFSVLTKGLSFVPTPPKLSNKK